MLRAPTPRDLVTDAEGQPYFIWDVRMTLDCWLRKVHGPNVEDAAYW